MTRVSTLGQNQLLLVDVLRQQDRINLAQKQVTSGTRSRDFEGIAGDVATLLGAKTVAERTEQYLKTNIELERITQLTNTSLQGLVDTADSLRKEMISAINIGSGIGLRDQIDSFFDITVSLLNQRDNGHYLFSGTRTDTAPVNVSTPAALEALGANNAANAFSNNDIKTQAKIDDNQTLTYGVLAKDVAKDLMQLMQDLMIFATASTGKFSDPLSDTDRTFLLSKIAASNTAFDTLNTAQAKHGVTMRTLQEAQDRHRDDSYFIRSFIADIEDVDVAEAITRLNADQTALEASFHIFSQVNRITLLDFI